MTRKKAAPPNLPATREMSMQAEVGAPTGPSQLYEEIILRTTDKRKLRSLENVRRALEVMREQKTADFTVASVARTIQALGLRGPKEQSMRNAEGKDFRDLITAYVQTHGKEQQTHGKEQRATANTEIDAIVSSIPDLRTAAQVRWTMVENRSLKRRLDLLRAAFTKLVPVRLAGENGEGRLHRLRRSPVRLLCSVLGKPERLSASSKYLQNWTANSSPTPVHSCTTPGSKWLGRDSARRSRK